MAGLVGIIGRIASDYAPYGALVPEKLDNILGAGLRVKEDLATK
jgi:hypothetical protein